MTTTEIHPDYIKLVRQFPLRPIRTKRQQAQAMKALEPLAVMPEDSLTPGQQDYLDTLCLLLEDYDRQQEALPKVSGLDLLKSLMEARDMTVNELGKVVGSQPNASLILSGQRAMSTAVMRKLGEFFGLPAGAFLA